MTLQKEKMLKKDLLYKKIAERCYGCRDGCKSMYKNSLFIFENSLGMILFT